jgi:hypothetical protein
LYGESRLKEEQGDRFHHFESVVLVLKERLVSPHASHEEFFVFEQKGECSDQQVNGSFEHSLIGFLCNRAYFGGQRVHAPDGLCEGLRNL